MTDEPEFAELADTEPGEGIIRLTVWLTWALAVTAVLAVIVPDVFVFLSVPVALALFVVGAGALAWGYVTAIGRSRYETITLTALFLAGENVARPRVRRVLLRLLAIQVAVALATAAARPFTPLAFGVLGPLSAYGLLVLWVARHGEFPPKGRGPAEAGAPEPEQ